MGFASEKSGLHESVQQNATQCNVLENQSDDKALSGQQMLAAEMLASGKTLQQVCSELSIDRTTLWRWRKLGEFRDRVRECQSDIFDDARSRLRGMIDASIDVIGERLDQCYEPLKFRAAITVLRLTGLSKAIESRDV